MLMVAATDTRGNYVDEAETRTKYECVFAPCPIAQADLSSLLFNRLFTLLPPSFLHCSLPTTAGKVFKKNETVLDYATRKPDLFPATSAADSQFLSVR